METNTKSNQSNATNVSDVKARLAALGFKNTKNIGLNLFKQEIGETLIIKITSAFEEFETKEGDKLKYVSCVNLETGEEGHVWTGGQLYYKLTQMKDGFVGGTFALTYKGLNEDTDSKAFHEYDIIAAD